MVSPLEAPKHPRQSQGTADASPKTMPGGMRGRHCTSTSPLLCTVPPCLQERTTISTCTEGQHPGVFSPPESANATNDTPPGIALNWRAASQPRQLP